MLAVSFFTLIFSSMVWLIYALRFISDNLGSTSFFSAGATNILIYVLLVCLPIFLMWLVFGFINQYLSSRSVNTQLQKLFGQMKRNQDYSDLLARVLIETEQQVKDGFILGKFDLLISDMNELLAEVIQASNIASAEQIERLWNKVQNGGKWSFGKVIIEVNHAQPNFQARIYEKACHDIVLSGTIMEFCARYQSVIGMLEKHDKERTFLNMIETGVMGKVFSIFAPIADEVRKVRESGNTFRQPQPQTFKAPEAPNRPRPKPATVMPQPRMQEAVSPYVDDAPLKSLLGKMSLFKKKNHNEEPSHSNPGTVERDPFTMALERSFGTPSEQDETPRLRLSEEVIEQEAMPTPMVSIQREPMLGESESVFQSAPLSATKDEPRFEIETPNVIEETHELRIEKTVIFETPAPVLEPTAIMEPKMEPQVFSNTQKTLNNLRKEWGDYKSTTNEPTFAANPINDTPVKKKTAEEEENLVYPFGGWVDEQNYNK